MYLIKVAYNLLNIGGRLGFVCTSNLSFPTNQQLITWDKIWHPWLNDNLGISWVCDHSITCINKYTMIGISLCYIYIYNGYSTYLTGAGMPWSTRCSTISKWFAISKNIHSCSWLTSYISSTCYSISKSVYFPQHVVFLTLN